MKYSRLVKECSAQNIRHSCAPIDPALGPDQEWMEGSEHCIVPAKIVFRSTMKVNEVFDIQRRKGDNEQEKKKKPFRLSKKCYLQKTNAYPSRTWQNPTSTSQRLQNPFSRSTNRRPLSHFGTEDPAIDAVLSHSSQRARSRAHATLSRPELGGPECLGAFCTWSDTHGRGFRDRLSVRNTRTVTRRAQARSAGEPCTVQRKIWAAADFQNFLARPNSRRSRKKGG